MKEEKQAQILNLLNQITEKFIYEDLIENGKKLDGESWNIHYLRLLRKLIEEYFNEEQK